MKNHGRDLPNSGRREARLRHPLFRDLKLVAKQGEFIALPVNISPKQA
jgi:hypothetical protein